MQASLQREIMIVDKMQEFSEKMLKFYKDLEEKASQVGGKVN